MAASRGTGEGLGVSSILVSSLINIEVTLWADRFPIEYSPVRYPFYGVNSTVSGVGYNVAKALTVLGNPVNFLSLIGKDFAGKLVQEQLRADRIPDKYVLPCVEQSAHSVIIYDGNGRRQINVDLKDIQEQVYPPALFEEALGQASIAALCNINFSRPMLQKAKQAGKLIATDVHAISSLDDDYNRDFMAHADILFMSHELLPCSPEEWAGRVQNRYGSEIIVIGLGPEGALLAVKTESFIGRFPSVQTRPIVSTIGAGDALFSCFLHVYHQTQNPYGAIQKAIVFASYKIGSPGAADGFLDAAQLETHYNEIV